MKMGGVLIKSNNALIAEDDGRYPLTEAKQRLKRRCPRLTLDQCRWLLKVLWHGEWHHVSAYANEVPYYDVERTLAEYLANPSILDRYQKKITAEKAVIVKIVWREWYGSRTNPKHSDHEYSGPATIKGKWITFVNGEVTRRKNTTGKWITVTILEQQEAE